MKIPEIVTRHKIRDAKICDLFLDGELDTDQIGGQVGISGRQVRRILYANRSVLKLDKEYEKIKRIIWLKKQIKKRGDTKQDSAALMDQLRVETEGNKVEHSGKIEGPEQRIVIVYPQDWKPKEAKSGLEKSDSQNRIHEGVAQTETL